MGTAPTQAAVDAHLAGLADALPGETLPVRWAFPGGDRVYWERRAALVPYHEDYAAWLQAHVTLLVAPRPSAIESI